MLSRRQLLWSLGASAAGAMASSRVGATPQQPIGSPANRAQIVDADFDVTPYLARLKAAGIKTIGRYYDRGYGTGIGEVCYHHPQKVLTRAEMAAIEQHGMSVFIVFQHCGHQCANFNIDNKDTAEKGRKDAEGAVRLAEELGQPAHTPIYFAIDFDPMPGSDCALKSDRIWPSVEAYFDQINEVFAKTKLDVGIYGAGITSRRLKAAGRAKYFWVSTSLGHFGTPEFFNGGDWHIFQNVTEIKRSYAKNTFDTNLANPGQTYFGQWTTKGPALPHSAVEATAILASRAFVRKGCVVLSHPDPKAKGRKAAKLRYNSTCWLLTPEIEGCFGVSLTEDDQVDGYVHRSDLILGGLAQNMPKWSTPTACTAPPVAVTAQAKPTLNPAEAKLLPLR